MKNAMQKLVQKAAREKVVVSVPGSKSVTHRAFIIAGLAEGESLIQNPLDSDDTRITAGALKSMGVGIPGISETMKITGTGGAISAANEEIYLGDSGTSMRLLTAVASLGKGEFYLHGSKRLNERPVGHLVEALKKLGVDVRCRNDRYPPVVVKSGGIPGGDVELDVSESSQYLSALLLVLPYAEKKSSVMIETHLASRPYVDITTDMMEMFGAKSRWINERKIEVDNDFRYSARKYRVEGDCSSASYFWAAAALLGIQVTTLNIKEDTRQGDIRLLDILEEMGCDVSRSKTGITVTGGRLRGVDVDMNLLPDQVPTLAVVAACAEGKTVIRNVSHLRIKESDRLNAVARELQRVGIRVDELEDGLVVHGGSPKGAIIETYNDHRIAMAFAVLGLKTGEMTILNPSCVNKSFPAFWTLIESFYS